MACIADFYCDSYFNLQKEIRGLVNGIALWKDLFALKVNAWKLFNNKYKIASIQTANTEVLAFIVVLVFKLLSLKVLFKKVGYFLRKYQISWVNYCKFINS